MSIQVVFLYFVIYAFFGWVSETIYVGIGTKKIVNRGFLHSPVCPIYGFGALLVLFVLDPFYSYPVIVFLLGIVSTSALEYFTSWLMEVIFHASWWDYSKRKYNLNGRICLKNSILFGIMGLFAVYLIHPLVESGVDKIPSNIQTILFVVLAIILSVDLVFSAVRAINVDKALQELHQALHTIYEEGDLAKEQATKNFEALIAKLEKRQVSIRKSFPDFEHLKFHFDRDILDDFIKKVQSTKIK